MKRALVGVALLLVILPTLAFGDDKPIKQKMKFTEKKGEIRVTTTIAKLFDSDAYEALRSGFESTIVVRMWVYKKGDDDPVSFQFLERKVIYDMWDELYEVQLDGPGGREKLKVKYQAEALKLLSNVASVPVVSADELPYEELFYLVIVAELNPVSDETLAEVRRWLTKGSGGGLDRGGSIFGRVVSVFVNPDIADADRVLRLKSQPFYRPEE
jgi:hypothetical protein